MMSRPKVIWVLFVTLGLIVFMDANTSLMASPSVSHATHFFSEKGPLLPHSESGCYVCHADGHDQCQGRPLFADHGFLETTHVCDNCHSPDGAFPGGDPSTSLLDPTIGAKANWDEGVYDSGGEMLKAGKEKWCITCHDDIPANSDWEGSGINAPDVSLYYTSGHGRPDADVECLVCHDATFTHIDGEPRTYAFSDEDVYPADFIVDMYAYANSGVAYAAAYRLRYVNGKTPLMIPASYETFSDQTRMEDHAYRRCFNSDCHDPFKIFSRSYNDGDTFSNFKGTDPNPPREYGAVGDGFHLYHLLGMSWTWWDSDWDVNTSTPQSIAGYDSMITCSTCHNVHGAEGMYGSTNEPMIRDGSLAERPGYGFSYVVEDPVLNYPWVTSDGATQSTSVGAVFRNGTADGEMCFGCHGTWPPPPGASYNASTIDIIYTGSHIGPASATVLTVEGDPWVEGELVGKRVKNVTDGGYDTEIIGNTSNTVTVEELWGGTDNTWQTGDQAEIFENMPYYMEYYRPWQDYSSTVDMIWTYDSHGGKDYGSLSVWEEDTDIDITNANDVVVLLHGGLIGLMNSGDTVTGQNSGATGVLVGVVTDSQICIDVTSGEFQNEEQIYTTQDVDYVISTSAPDHVGVMYLDCYDGPHVDRVELAGAITDAVHYRCIRSASDCTTPFAGKRETGAYFEYNQDDDVFYLNENHARLQDIGAKLTYTSDTSSRYVFKVAGLFCQLNGCVAYDSQNDGTQYAYGFLLGNQCNIVNSICHDIEAHGFSLLNGNRAYAYNCVAVDNGGHGFLSSSSDFHVYNCVGDNNGTADPSSYHDFGTAYSGFFVGGCNMSSDDTAPGSNSVINKDFTGLWVSETTGLEDYHLSESGVLDSDFQGGCEPSGISRLVDMDDVDGQPRSTWYRGVDEAGPPGHNYNIHTISGSVSPLDGVTMSGLPNNPVTSMGGLYSAIVSDGWSGTVTPSKIGYTFGPENRVYSNVTSDQPNQDYTPVGTFYTISGRVGTLDGITMDGFPDPTLKTSGGGFYSTTVGHGWSGTVYPLDYSERYRFEPQSIVYSNLSSDQLNQDYTPILTHEICGHIYYVEGVTLSGLPGDPVTGGSTAYYCGRVDDGWSGTVTPVKAGFTFDPPSRVYTDVTEGLGNQNYSPASGTVRFGDNSTDDYNGKVQDAVFPAEAAYRDNNYGAALYNHVGKSGDNDRRSLIRIKNIGTYIPAGRVITSATLYLYCSGENSPTDHSISAYRVLLNWGEGNSNGTPEVGAVCTNDAQYDDIIDWNSIGCNLASDAIGENSTADRRATAEDSCLITGTGWFSWDLTNAVQNWYSKAWSEYGVILINDQASVPDSVKIFHSSESLEDGKRPYLEVTFSTP